MLMSEEVLKVLAHPANRAILNLLRVEPTYPRKVADLLSLSETEVARRLRKMEKLGLLRSAWHYIGKNVKLYELVAEKVVVAITPEGIRIDMDGGQGEHSTLMLDPFRVRIPEVEGFVGRNGELDLLAQGHPVTVVEAMPGMGKTQLVAAYVRANEGKVPVFWHTFRGVESLDWLANRLAVFFAQRGDRKLLDAIEQGAELAERRERLFDALDRPGTLVVFDDTHEIQDEAVSEFLTDAIDRLRNGRLVITTRKHPRFRPTDKHVHSITLEGLSDAAVAAMFERREVALDQTLILRVRAEVGGHPLALELFIDTVKQKGVAIESLLDLIPEDGLEGYLLDEIMDTLDERESLVLHNASLFTGRFTAQDLTALTKKNPAGALLRLKRRFIVQASDHEYQLHEIIRNFFYQQVQDKDRLHGKLADHYLRKKTLEGRLEAMHHFLAADRKDRVLRLLEEDLDLREYDLIDTGYHHLYLRTLNLFHRNDVQDDRKWALIQDEIGDILFHRGANDEALERWSIAERLFEKLSDAERLGDLGWKRAMALHRSGRSDEAARACRKALDHAHKDEQTKQRLEHLLEELSQTV